MESPSIRPPIESPENSFYDYRNKNTNGRVSSGKAKTKDGQNDLSLNTFKTTRIPVSTYRGGKSNVPLQFSRDSGIATTSNLNGSTDQSQSINQQKITSGNKIESRLIRIGSLKPSQIPLRKYGTRTIISDTKSEGHTEKPSTNKNVHTVPLVYKPDLHTEAIFTSEETARLEISPTTSTLRQSEELLYDILNEKPPFDTLLSYPRSQSTGFSLDSDDSGKDMYNDHMTGFPRGENVTAVYDSIVVATNKIKAVNENVSRWLNDEFKIPIERPPKTSSTCRYCSMTESSRVSDKIPTYLQDNINANVMKETKDKPKLETWNDIHIDQDKMLKRIKSKPYMTTLKYQTGNATYLALETKGFKCQESISGVNIDLQYPSNSTMRTPDGGIPVPSYTVCPSEILQKTTNFECFDSIPNSMATDLDIHGNISSQFTMEHTNEYATLDAWCPHSCQNFANHAKCTKCSPDKTGWTLRENQDAYSDNTNKDSGPHHNNQLYYYKEDYKKPREHNNDRNIGKSPLPSKKYKVSRQIKTLRSRYLQQRRWIHVWKKKTKWHTWARSPFKFKKFRMLHHMQRAVLWEDVDVQTNIVVFREIGTGVAMWQLKSACVTTSANFGFLKNSCDIKKSDIHEKDRSSFHFKIPFKHINIGPSRFPFSGNSHASSQPISKKSTQESIKKRRESTSEPSRTFGFFGQQPKASIKCYVHNYEDDTDTRMNRSLSPIEFEKEIMDTVLCSVTETNINQSLTPTEFEKKIMLNSSFCHCTDTEMTQTFNSIEFDKNIMDSAICSVTETKVKHPLGSLGLENKIVDNTLCAVKEIKQNKLNPIIECKPIIIDNPVYAVTKTKLNRSLSPIEFKPKVMDSAICTVTETKLNRSLSPIELKPKIMDSAICTVTETKLNQCLSPIKFKPKIMDSAVSTVTETKLNQSLSPIEIKPKIKDSALCTEKIHPKLTQREISITEVSVRSESSHRYERMLKNNSTDPIKHRVGNSNTQTFYLTNSVGILKKDNNENDKKSNRSSSPIRFEKKVLDSVICTCTETTRPKLTKKDISITEVSVGHPVKRYQKVLQNACTEPMQHMVENINTQTVYVTNSIGVLKKEKTNEDETQMTPAPTHERLKIIKSFGTQQSHDRIRSEVADKEQETDDHILPMSHYTILLNGTPDYQGSEDSRRIILPYYFDRGCRCGKNTPVKYNKQTMKTFRLDKPEGSDKTLSEGIESYDKRSSNGVGTESEDNSSHAIASSVDHEPTSTIDSFSMSGKSCEKKNSFDIDIQIYKNKNIKNFEKSSQESKSTVVDLAQSHHKKSAHKIGQLYEGDYKITRNADKSSPDSKKSIDVKQSRHIKSVHKLDSHSYTHHSSKSYVILEPQYNKTGEAETEQSGNKMSKYIDTHPRDIDHKCSKGMVANIKKGYDKHSPYDINLNRMHSSGTYLLEPSLGSHKTLVDTGQCCHPEYGHDVGSSRMRPPGLDRMRSSGTYLVDSSVHIHKKLVDTGQSCHRDYGHDIETQACFEPTPKMRPVETPDNANLNFKMHLSRTHNRTSQSTLVKSLYQPFIFEVGTMSSINKLKSIGLVTSEATNKTNDKSVMPLVPPLTVSASTSTDWLMNTKSTGGSMTKLGNVTLDAYAQYSTYKCGELTNTKEVQTDREIKSAAVLTSCMHVDKATEAQYDDSSTCDCCRKKSFTLSNNQGLRKSKQFDETLKAATARCRHIPLAETPSTTGLVIKENNIGNLPRLMAKTSRANPRKKLVASAPALYDDDASYCKWYSRDYCYLNATEFPETEEAKLAKLISRTCRYKKSKSHFVRAGRSVLKYDAPKPFEKLSRDSFVDGFPREIPEIEIYQKNMAAESDEIAVFRMPVMIDKETSDTESKDLKETILQTSPEKRDAETESFICNRRSAGVLTSQTLMPQPTFCYPYPDINPLLADCVFLYDTPPCGDTCPGYNTTVQKYSIRDCAYNAMFNATKLVKSMNVMTDGGADAFGFISTGTSTCAPLYKSSPMPSELIRTCSKNYHARVLHLPPFFDRGFDEEPGKKPMYGSCRYYSNLLTKQLVRMKENLKNLKNAEDCALYQHVSSVHCPPDCTACTMIPSGRVELCCQTTKRSKIGTPLSRCVMAPSVTNIGDGQDKKHLKSIYYMLTAIEGRIRRLKHNIPN